jgi:2,3-bisphosphoglycerate-independent phosphoglycerate mutase
MKTALVLYEGMADEPSDLLEQRTPMQTAGGPVATGWAVTGQGGLVARGRPVAEGTEDSLLAAYLGLTPDDRAGLSRGPLEALGAGLSPPADQWVFRADFVTMDGEQMSASEVRHLRIEETRLLAEAVQTGWAEEGLACHVLAPGRVAVYAPRAVAQGVRGVSPFTVNGDDLRSVLPARRATAFVRKFLDRSRELLATHPVNEVRVDLGENPANALWLWGGGPMPVACGSGKDAGEDRGVLVTQSLMALGLARQLGMAVVDLGDPWSAMAARRVPFRVAALTEALRMQRDLVMYVAAPRSGGRYGGPADKVRAVESLDHYLLGKLRTMLEAFRPYRIALAVDGAVRAGSGRPAGDPLPLIVSGADLEPDGTGHWDEVACAGGALGTVPVERVWGLLRKE